MKECMGDDGETYVELNGMWYKKSGDRLETASKPKVLISCKIITKDKEKEFFTKHLVKDKGSKD